MTLAQIIKNCGVLSCTGGADINITDVVCDSRRVVPGSLFVAVNGCGNDGRAYIQKAVENGAAAVMFEDNGTVIPDSVCAVKVADSRKAVAMAADAFFEHPSGDLKLVGITGTNGKTTTVTLLYNLFRSMGYECGLLSTIANYVGSKRLETANTTSDPLTINSLLRRMADEGCQYCFMEVSSIGVEQERVTGLEFAVGIFSNLTHDHLDYHGTFAEYLRCKKLFFDRLSPKATAITNIDDKHGEVMLQNTAAAKMTYSCRSMADHNCRILEQSPEGMLIRIDGSELWSRLVGAHNAYNLLAIYCTALALGEDRDEVLTALSALGPAPGRMETIHGPRGLCAVIDYAHTPDALENVLKTLKAVVCGRQLVCLFGCGGDRDRTKRPEMAAVAEKWADRIFVTSDNSRTERTEDIMNDIRAGFSPAGLAKTIFISDRREAIRTALMTSPDGATVLLAGKGHETYQIIGTEKTHFDEKEIVNEIFKQCSTTL
ncbi:MAG: UDP-N-acetylmuramoyl-L-alanyl-D-glutamate--2,6-diaminopimelate ligase [Bacteroidales bacterium]|nr:UDP-N-acetylmuramoyl-L-alanyl-D-glutamate--2,6-diaminopimelate ligase [Bacteroidales bacterium]